MVRIESRRTPSTVLMTSTGMTVFVLAFIWLLVTGHTEIAQSADPGATKASLWAAVLPPLAAVALARLVPPAREALVPLAELPGTRLRREAWALVSLAVLTVVALPVAGGASPLVKGFLLLPVSLMIFRMTRRGGPKARAVPAPVTWLAPLPAVLAWFLLSQVSPLAVPLTQDLPDPVTLAIGSLLTLLTASVLEEIFYRAWLQTRLEVLYGRWPAIMASSLLFALMHSARIEADAPLLGLATVIAFQGVFGLMVGYLWSRYRNIWAIILIHTITNLVYVPLLLGNT
ncbi:lysostaphin resistance A-like protein [Actinomadura sp. 6N118]|uniref:lysostaphin resistance A-like protein n=1 Tax=Actinomadura sp. 6N118 TaxID=3375151 RepID=UPI0037B385B6